MTIDVVLVRLRNSVAKAENVGPVGKSAFNLDSVCGPNAGKPYRNAERVKADKVDAT